MQMTIDTREAAALLARLDLSRQQNRRAIRGALAEAAAPIRTEARKNLRSVPVKGGTTNRYAPLGRHVRTTVKVSGGEARVDAWGKKRKKARRHVYRPGDGIDAEAYILHFLENGTAPRWQQHGQRSLRRRNATGSRALKKKRYTGRIRPSKFFSRAVFSQMEVARARLGRGLQMRLMKAAAGK